MVVPVYFCEKWRESEPLTITLTGAGNTTHVLAGLLGSTPNTTVNILNVLGDECARLIAASEPTNRTFTLSHEDGKAPQVGQVTTITSNPALVIPQTDVYIVTVPANAHEIYLRAAAPFLRDGAAVGVMVAQGGIDYCAKFALGHRLNDVSFFAFQTLPWACRTIEFGQSAIVCLGFAPIRALAIKGIKTLVDMVALPPSHGPYCRDMAAALFGLPMLDAATGAQTKEKFPEFKLLANFLTPALMNPNAIVHPSIIYGAFADWDGRPFSSPPLFYQGLGDVGADQMSGVSDEILAIKAVVLERQPAFNLDTVMHMRDFILYSYGDDVVDQTSLRTSFNTNKGYKGLTHPCVSVEGGGYVPDFQHRYLTEDIPTGLVVIKGIALLAGVETPRIDSLLYWCQERIGKEYLVNGQLAGKDMHETRAPQRYNIERLDDVLN